MAVADEVWMLENAIYSILSPEGFASIPVSYTHLDVYKRQYGMRTIWNDTQRDRENLRRIDVYKRQIFTGQQMR